MTALSIHLSESLAKASQKVAAERGISRTELIRQALIHEIENFYIQRELEEMAKCFGSMRNSPAYLKEIKGLSEGLESDNLPDEDEEWWKKK